MDATTKKTLIGIITVLEQLTKNLFPDERNQTRKGILERLKLLTEETDKA